VPLISVIITLVAMTFVCSWFIKFVPQDKRLLLYTLGKFEGVRGPGIVFVIPAFQTFQIVNVEPTITEVVLKQARTSDGALVDLTLKANYWITAPEKALADTSNHEALINSAIQPIAREQIEKHLFANFPQNKRKISSEICSRINTDLSSWGIHVGSVDIQM
jgi:regulator of protease activity HflC (stomatin/prohibitin superfamily)